MLRLECWDSLSEHEQWILGRNSTSLLAARSLIGKNVCVRTTREATAIFNYNIHTIFFTGNLGLPKTCARKSVSSIIEKTIISSFSARTWASRDRQLNELNQRTCSQQHDLSADISSPSPTYVRRELTLLWLEFSGHGAGKVASQSQQTCGLSRLAIKKSVKFDDQTCFVPSWHVFKLILTNSVFILHDVMLF